MNRTARVWVLLATWGLWTAGTAAHADGGDLTEAQLAELSQHFGFGAMQIYKLKPGIGQLRLADLNGDRRTDIALWNSHQNRIEILFQPDPAGPPPTTRPVERNELPDRGNLRVESVPVAYRIASLEIADVTGDQKPDLVFFGEPKELVVVPGHGDGTFGTAEGIRAPEGDARSGGLAVGDFDGDGRTDVALLGPELLLIFPQKPGGGLGKPQRIVHNVSQPLLLLSGDYDGDGRTDLVLGSDEDTYGAYAWLQQPGGALGPQQRVKVPKLRSMTVARGEKGDDLFGIEAVAGRLRHYRWDAKPDVAGAVDWPQTIYTYPTRSQSKRRPLAVGDVTNDGLADVVAADPDAAQLILFEQTGVGLLAGVAYPGLSKTLDICVADIEGDGKREILAVSAEEKMIGVSRYEEGRITFPTPLPTQGEPLAITVGALKAGDLPRTIAYVSREKGEASMVLMNAAGAVAQSWKIEDLSDEPGGVRFADVNQDGLNDLLLFVRFNPLQTFLQKPDGTFERLHGAQTRDGLVKDAPVEGFELADVDGDDQPEVLLVQKNFARALAVREGQWTVVDQYNPESSDAQLTGLAVLPDRPGSPTVVLYDKKSRDVIVLKRREDQAYAVAQTMPLGAMELTAMTSAALRAGQTGLLVADAKTLVVVEPQAAPRTFVEKHAYESTVKDAWLMDTVVGDLNHDGVRDIAVLDGRKAAIEVLTTLPDGELAKVQSFQVFQGKRFRDAPDARGEPREAQIGDVTGDQIDDLVVVVHDRVIVYPGQ